MRQTMDIWSPESNFETACDLQVRRKTTTHNDRSAKTPKPERRKNYVVVNSKEQVQVVRNTGKNQQKLRQGL